MSGKVLSAAKAAEAAGVSPKTMSRHLKAGKVPGAERLPSGGWAVPEDGLREVAKANGYTLRTGPDPAPDAAAQVAEWRERALVAEAKVQGLTGELGATQQALGHAEKRLLMLEAGAPVAAPAAPVATPEPVPVSAPLVPRGTRRWGLRGWMRRG